MSEIQDCATIIAADMRQLADDIAAGRAIVGQSVWRSYADRVEKIGTGNVAKLREALKTVKRYLDGYTVNVLEMRSQVDAALAAPPRNCDVGTARQQEKRHKEEVCPKSACPQHEGFVSKACRGCFAMWAQMPCKEGGAK